MKSKKVSKETAETSSSSGIMSDLDLYLFGEGRHWKLYEKMGAHPMTVNGQDGVGFAVWAPNARDVSVIGNFNYWDGSTHRMHAVGNSGVWELFIPGIGVGEIYKYRIFGHDGTAMPDKTDPYGFQFELRPRTGSIVAELNTYQWNDQSWMESRKERQAMDAPMLIYEVHLGSWRRHYEGNQYYTYRDLARELVPYVADMGFTHIELLPITEYPFDGSWGYQPIGLFAPTSRYGTPDDFRFLVDAFHARGIGVILDFVPGHFPVDEHGLAMFDGTHLYDHADWRQGFHPDWNTAVFNYGRHEVTNYLIAAALFWGEQFHLDALRVDAVASMLYLDYSRRPGEWIPNQYGGRENIEAIDFLRRMNEVWYGEHPGAITMAEESTAWPMVSRPTYLGGLGFGYKWNMGWMHDTLDYIGHDPIHRSYYHHHLTFGLLYQFTENFILPISHDEVVHGKGSLIQRMPGDQWQQFANLRAYLGFMYGHPGKKLLFMGCEFGQYDEWNHDRGLDWQLLGFPLHAGVLKLVADLNGLVRAHPALYERDFEPEGFEWLEGNDSANSVLAFLRYSADRREILMVICNFTPVVRHEYRLGIPFRARFSEVMNTDSQYYQGSNVGNPYEIWTDGIGSHGKEQSILLTLPPLATSIFKVELL
jgi:1,4-alpha-glucan branching enzyme